MRFLKRFLRYFLCLIAGVLLSTAVCFAYLSWFQPPFYFPKPTGQYAVGVHQYHWVDSMRKETCSKDPQHPSRELMVKVWYPTNGTLPEKTTLLWAPDLVQYMKQHYKFMWLLTLSRPLYSWAEPDAMFKVGSDKFPVIIFSHGYGACNQDSNAAQCEELASHGYVVVAINHTNFSVLATFPDGRAVDYQSIQRNKKPASNFTERQQISNQELEIWVDDVQFVLNKLEQVSQDMESLLYQRLDLEHIGMFGHSFGGAATIQMCRRDHRVKAGVDLDGGLFGFDVSKTFDKPLMFLFMEGVVKAVEKSVTKDLREDFKITSEAEEKAFKAVTYLSALDLAQSIGHDTYILSFKNFGHLDFSYGAQIKVACPLLRFASKLFRPGMVGSINGLKATEIVNAYLLNFFDKYLKGHASQLLDGQDTLYNEVERQFPKSNHIS